MKITEKQQALVNRIVTGWNHDWYAVVYDDGEVMVKHNTVLSNVLECGHSPERYGIVHMQRCGN
jgi:hypothetical protein